MSELLTTMAPPAEPRSANEINQCVRQIERDLVILQAMPRPEAGLNGAAGAQVKELTEDIENIQSLTTQHPLPSNGSLERLCPGGSKTRHPGLFHLALRGLCRIGVDHGEWGYLSRGRCNQSREYVRCGLAETWTTDSD